MIANVYLERSGNSIYRVNVDFDEQETWTLINRAMKASLIVDRPISEGEAMMEVNMLMLQLIGHCLGFCNSWDRKSVMFNFFTPRRVQKFCQSDLNMAKKKYYADSPKRVLKARVRNNVGCSFFQNKLVFAYAAKEPRNRICVLVSPFEGVFEEKIVLDEETRKGISLCPFREKLFMAFTDPDHYIVIMCSHDGKDWGERVKLAERTSHHPALTVHDNRLVLAFTSEINKYEKTIIEINKPNINLITSTDGKFWSGKRLLPFEVTGECPAVTSLGDKLYFAWVGYDLERHVNVGFTTDFGKTPLQKKTVLFQRSVASPDLHTLGGRVFLSFVDCENKINISCNEEENFRKVKVLDEKTDFIPQLVENYTYGQMAVVWRGLGDPKTHLNMMKVC